MDMMKDHFYKAANTALPGLQRSITFTIKISSLSLSLSLTHTHTHTHSHIYAFHNTIPTIVNKNPLSLEKLK
jgi:hypothetical protein